MNNLTDKECDQLTDKLLRKMKKEGLINTRGFGSSKVYFLTKKGVRAYETHPLNPKNQGNN